MFSSRFIADASLTILSAAVYIFTDHFVPARVDFGITFSIKFLSSSALLGFRKALAQEAMSSSVSRRKV